MSETVRKFLWVEPIDMDHFEGWLEDMARKGLHYHHSGPLFVHFRRGEPEAVRFRLEPAGSLGSRESQNYCRSLGWERLGEIGRDLELYRNADPEAPDLHTDPVVRSYGLEQLAKLIKRRAVVIALCLAVFVAAVLSPLFLLDFPVELFLTGSATVLFSLVLEVLAMASSLRAFASFFALRRRLREGVPSRRDGSWRRVAVFNMALAALTGALLLFCAWSLTVSFDGGWEGALDAVAEPYPILELGELEDNPALETDPSSVAVELFGYDRDNSVRYSRYPLLSEMYEVEQHLTDGGEYDPSLTMEWYRLSLPCLASPLLEELVYRYTEHNYFPDEYIVSEPALPGFDRAVLAEDRQWGHHQKLFLQAGNVVVCLRYYGDQDLTARPELLEELAAWRPSPG